MARVFVSIGSNIEREMRTRAALETLRARYGKLTLSTLYESEAVGFEGEPFFNAVVAFDTDESVHTLSQQLDLIEEAQGRMRGSARFAPRTLDLDLLLYDDLIIDEEGLQLPRGEITRYAFVLLPLSEIAPDLRHPQSGERYADMWAAFSDESQQLWPVAIDLLATEA